MAAIYPRLQTPERRFVLLGAQGEDLKKPFEIAWQDTANYPYDDPRLLSHQGNYGVCGGYGDLHIVDSDDLERWAELGVLPLIPYTFTIESRPGHRQFYLTCKEHFQSGGLFDPEKTEINAQGKPEYAHIGDLKAGAKEGICGGQAVGPGCRHPNGSTYTVVVDEPIAEVSREHLQSIISRFKTSKKVNTNYQRCEEDASKARQRRYAEKDPLDALRVVDIMPPAGVRSKSGDELRGDHPVHGSTNGGNYVINTAKNVWHCKRCESGGGPALAIAVKHGLISCSDAQAGELRGDLFKEVLRIAKAQYLPHEGSGADEPRRTEGSEEIHLKALEILQHGDPSQYIADNCGRMVLGAEKAFKKLICCVAVQGIKQSSGLHPKLNGESGSGKTWVVLTFAHHLPPEVVVKGSSSNLAAFYHQDGDLVFRILDDYQAGNETLDTIIKQTSSVFHQKYDHRTVKKQEPVTLYIGSEQTWAITSVDSSQDIQVLNRQIPINVDDSEVLTRKVNARTIQRYGEGEGQFPEDETVQVCREIWRILRADGLISVKIPFWQRIEWLEVSNRRNPSLFMDLLVAHTAMNRYQREKDSEGYHLATEEDFNAAKALFTDKDAEELVHRLTRKEREFTDLLSKHPGGLTREEAAEALQISVNRVSQLAYGEKGKGGLTQKLPGFTAEDITDSEMLDAGECKRRSTKRTLFKLSRYDALTGFDAVVVLKDRNNYGEDRKDRKDGVRSSVRIDECKENSNGERENREREIECKECKDNVREALGKDKSEIFPLSLKNPEKSLHQDESASIDAKDILTPSLPNPYGPYAKALDGDEDSLHPKCDVCGADLAGKGQIEKGGKLYCARPGCGYPERGEAGST